MRKIIQIVLSFLAIKTLKKYHPLVIGITGSFGKTSTKEAVALILKKYYRVRANYLNLNTEIGVPLTVIGGKDARRNVFIWLENFFKAFLNLIFKDKEYPEVLVLEMAADKPNDIKYLSQLIKPKIGILTGIGLMPVHIAQFKNREELVKEKSLLIKNLPEDGFAILNGDNESVFDLKDKTKAGVITFGFDNSSLKISDYKFRQAKDLKQSGISFRLGYKGSFVPVILNGVISKANAYALSAAAAVGAALNLNLVEIAEAMSNFKPPPGRLNIISGIKNSWILDDTYNASPDSMNLALETLKEIQAKRKIVVLGDMLELGEYSEEAHLLIGQNVFQYADAFFAIGPKMKFAYDEAEKNHMEKDKICWFNTSQEACLMIQNYIQEGDVILIKGSRGMHMEQIVEEIKA